MVGYALVALPQKPLWLEALLSEKFFAACANHSTWKKNERNIYCIDCSVGICQHCLLDHSAHRLLQIRRYVYHDVIRLQDLQKLVDCSQVQTYIINSARVVFLNQRPQPRPSKGSGNICETCERSLQDAYRYCSVACKVDAVMLQGKDLQGLLPHCNLPNISDLADYSHEYLKTGELESEDQLSPAASSPTSSGSTANDSVVWTNCCSTSTTSCAHRIPTDYSGKADATAISPRSVILPSLNRRKGIPHRSPFC